MKRHSLGIVVGEQCERGYARYSQFIKGFYYGNGEEPRQPDMEFTMQTTLILSRQKLIGNNYL